MHRARQPGRRFLAIGLAMLLTSACGSRVPATEAPPTAAVPTLSPSPQATIDSASSPTVVPSAVPSPAPTPTPDPADLTKRPFTVLVLGGDNGLRTDAIIVAGIDPIGRQVTFASLPRDTIDLPLPGGGVFRQQKVNAFYNFAAANPGTYPQGPGRAMADAMQLLLGVRIDNYALTTFSGFSRLVNVMGGVLVNVPSRVVDPYYQITMTDVGIQFNAGPQVMSGDRALIYSRTRLGDSDFERSRRQQVFLAAAGSQLLSHPELLGVLLGAAGNLRTDFPLGQLPGLIAEMMAGPSPSIASGTVFGPSRYSSTVPCTCGYALEPNLPVIRQSAAELFPWAVITP